MRVVRFARGLFLLIIDDSFTCDEFEACSGCQFRLRGSRFPSSHQIQDPIGASELLGLHDLEHYRNIALRALLDVIGAYLLARASALDEKSRVNLYWSLCST
jgi:hypothetical protein